MVVIDVARIFDWGGANHKSHAMAHQKLRKRIFCGGKDIAEWKIRSRGLVLARNWELVQEGKLKPIVKMQKCLNWETCLSKEVYSNWNLSQTGVWGRSPQPPDDMEVWGQNPLAAGRCFGKKSYFNTIGLHFSRIQIHLKVLDFSYYWKPIQKIKLFNPPFACNLSPKHV